MQPMFLLLWLILVLYAIFLAPPIQPTTLDFVFNVFQFKLSAVDPIAFMVFNLLGVWPAIYAAVLLLDGHQQRLPSWPFVLSSFGTGAFALLPYLAFRRPHRDFQGPPSSLIKLFEHRLVAVFLFVIATGLVLFGLLNGNLLTYLEIWSTDRLINVMTIDALLVIILFPYPMYDDMHRRRYYSRERFLFFALIPLYGPLFYLLLRPQLEVMESVV